MNTKITPSQLSGTIEAPPSKSDLHRALISTALSEKSSIILHNGCDLKESISLDILSTVNCLRAAGAVIDINTDKISVTPIDRYQIIDGYSADCGESGSTLRFILPIFATFGKQFTLSGHGRLPERPIKDLREQLELHGCIFSNESLPFTVNGKLKSGDYKLPGNISSQYISGLLFALPILSGNSTITLTTNIESTLYIKMTMNTLRHFGIDIIMRGHSFEIKGGQKYEPFDNYRVEGDWSNSAFWLCAGALSENGITCIGLDHDSLQPDRKILEILKKIGADIEHDNNKVTVTKKHFKCMTVDVSECPDLVPVLAVLLSVCRGHSRIINAGRLRIKESDRLKAISVNLQSLGAIIEEKDDCLEITGVGSLKGGRVNGFNDHRIVMAMAVASIVCEEKLIIENIEAVNKSYRNFFMDFNRLGGNSNDICTGE